MSRWARTTTVVVAVATAVLAVVAPGQPSETQECGPDAI